MGPQVLYDVGGACLAGFGSLPRQTESQQHEQRLSLKGACVPFARVIHPASARSSYYITDWPVDNIFEATVQNRKSVAIVLAELDDADSTGCIK